MPSGAKKRKAAKKKKEKEKENQTQNGNSSTSKSNPQGDVSDGGEVGSKPQAKEWRPVTRAKSVEGESSDAEAVPKDGGVRIERDSKEGSKSNKRAGSGKESIKGSSSSSSSDRSSSDDESRVVERRRKEKGDATVSEEKKPASDLVKSVDSLLAEVTHSTNEAPAEKTTSLVAEKAPLAEKTTSLVAEKAPSAEKTTSLVAEKAPSAEKTPSLVAEKAPLAEKTASLVAEKAPSLDSDKPVVTVHFTETTPVDGLVISGTVVKPALESGAEKSLETLTDSLPDKIESIVCPPLIENGKASPTVVESVSKENGSKVLPSVGVVESVSKENGSKVLPSVGVSPAQTSNDAGSIKDSEIPEYSESQPLVAPAPRVVEKTSCFGLCGILDVITGSRI